MKELVRINQANKLILYSVSRHISTMFNFYNCFYTLLVLILFFQAAVVSILLYGCTSWTLTKHIEKKIDGNSTRMLQCILSKSWK